MKFKEKCKQKISAIQSKIDIINQFKEINTITTNPWIERLLQYGKLEHLDRQIVVEMVSMIYIYENKTVNIIYNFSDELEVLLQNSENFQQKDIPHGE